MKERHTVAILGFGVVGGGVADLLVNNADCVSEEIGDARKYAESALKHKEDMPKLADLFYRLSTEEMTHMAALHDAVAEIIADYRKEHGDPPESMLAVYNYLHEKQIDDAAEVKAMQGMYKGV